jgi:disease resistance protein RPS2
MLDLVLQVSEVDEDSSINRDWTRNNGWKEDGDSCL